jgi:hypothetical protein
MSEQNKCTVLAHELGYRVVGGEVISPYSGKPRKVQVQDRPSKCAYTRFTIHYNGSRSNVYTHKLLAYQKYGRAMFKPGIIIRHLDGNSLNNSYENIALGTLQDNTMDIPEEVRIRTSITAATKLRKFTDDEMDEIREFHSGSYKETMKAFGITSKATLHRILNVKYKTKV